MCFKHKFHQAINNGEITEKHRPKYFVHKNDHISVNFWPKSPRFWQDHSDNLAVYEG